jgi:exopolyphosphatase/guanosine-5'-triphosphate,3'-diphosphate pyrophosphatase
MAPRWEYRVWGEDLSELRAKVAALEASLGVRVSRETYLVGSPDTNAKIRAEILEVKRLLKTDRAFQLWTPTLKEPFPLAAATVSEVLAIVLGSDSPRLEVSSFEMANFLAQAKRAGVIVAEVSKRRDGYRHEGCLLEFAEVTVGGSTLHTVAIESEDLETAGDLAARMGISTLPNQSYPMTIRHALHI